VKNSCYTDAALLLYFMADTQIGCECNI